jgi:hypothetical protein
VPEGASEVLGGFAPVGLAQGSTPFAEPKEIPSVAALEGFTLLTVLEGLALVEVMAEVSVILGSTPQLWCCILNFFFETKQEDSRKRGNGEEIFAI